MLGRRPTPLSEGMTTPGRRRTLWCLAVLDSGIIAWMLSAGDWLDETAAVTRVVTWGGHHVLVLWAAIVGLVLLLSAAVLTENFTIVGRLSGAVLTLGVALSVLAVGGLASIAVFGVAVLLLVGVVGRAFH
jgi:hypothetical protein